MQPKGGINALPLLLLLCSYVAEHEGEAEDETDAAVQELLAQSKIWKMATNQKLSPLIRAGNHYTPPPCIPLPALVRLPPR